jgi:hypothetical protein
LQTREAFFRREGAFRQIRKAVFGKEEGALFAEWGASFCRVGWRIWESREAIFVKVGDFCRDGRLFLQSWHFLQSRQSRKALFAK